MASTKLGDTSLTTEWLEKTLQKSLNTKSSFSNVESKEIGVGMGFLSQIMRVTLDWKPEDKTLPATVIVKVPSTKGAAKAVEQLSKGEMKDAMKEVNEEKQSSALDLVHRCEVAVYEVFKSNPPPGVRVPKCYFSRLESGTEEAVIIIEDIAGASQPMTHKLTSQQLFTVAEALASLHAWSLTTDKWKHPDITMGYEKMSNPDTPSLDTFMRMCLPGLKPMVPEALHGSIDKLTGICSSLEGLCSHATTVNQKMGLPDVFVHGDLWVPNLIFENDPATGAPTAKIAGLIDWQICHPGNVGEDFARCFGVSVTDQMRRNEGPKVFKHYYDCLECKLGKKPPFSLEQLNEAYRRSFIFGGLFAIPAFAMILQNEAMLGPDPEAKKAELVGSINAHIEDLAKYCDEFGL